LKSTRKAPPTCASVVMLLERLRLAEAVVEALVDAERLRDAVGACDRYDERSDEARAEHAEAEQRPAAREGRQGRDGGAV